MESQDEQYLLVQLYKGKEEAFTALYNLYSKRLYANILHLVKDEEIAKELLQDLFLKIWESRKSLDPSRSFRSFLFVIAENLVYDHFRRVARDKKLVNQLLATSVSHYSHSEEMVIYEESFHIVQKAIAQLPPMRKQVYILSKMEGKSYEDIAAQLGISPSTISDHMVKANRFVKKFIYANTDVTLSVAACIILIDFK